MRGRKKIPDKLKALRGTDQPCRMSGEIKGELITTIDNIDFSVLKTKRAKDIFKKHANRLIYLNLLTEDKMPPLAMYSNNIDLLFLCMQHMKKGLFAERFDENGNIIGYIENPYVKMYISLQKEIIKQASEFGFTPSSSLKFAQVEVEKDELQTIISQYK